MFFHHFGFLPKHRPHVACDSIGLPLATGIILGQELERSRERCANKDCDKCSERSTCNKEGFRRR